MAVSTRERFARRRLSVGRARPETRACTEAPWASGRWLARGGHRAGCVRRAGGGPCQEHPPPPRAWADAERREEKADSRRTTSPACFPVKSAESRRGKARPGPDAPQWVASSGPGARDHSSRDITGLQRLSEKSSTPPESSEEARSTRRWAKLHV